MTYRALIRWSVFTMAFIIGLGIWALYKAPPGMEIPLHWNAAGQADELGPVLRGVMMTSLIGCGTIALIAAIPFFEPMQNKMDKSQPFYLSVWAAMLPFLLLLTVLILAPVFGWSFSPSILLVGIGFLFLVIGNMLPKSRRSFFMGIRTPWALSDEENWIATHRFGGRVFMLCGAGLLLSGMVPLTSIVRLELALAMIVVTVVLPIAYSFLYWRQHKGERRGGL